MRLNPAQHSSECSIQGRQLHRIRGIEGSWCNRPVAVEKGTKAVISVNFRAEGRRTFNNLRTNFAVGIPQKEFFNSHA
jgi:hypothetical protein